MSGQDFRSPGDDPPVGADVLHAAILSSAVDFAVIATDRSGAVLEWNPGAEAILGWTAAEMLGQLVDRIFTEDDRASGRPGLEMRLSIENGRASDERWHVRRDGTRFWANGEMMPLRLPGGHHLGYLKILRDRTDEEQAAAMQAVDAEFMRSVLSSSADCIKVLDLDANLVFMSEGGQRVMEVSDFNALRGCPWPDFWVGDGNTAALEAVATARAGGTGRFQGPADTAAGNPREWDVQVTPILGKDGKPEKLLSISRDVTTIRTAERDLRLVEERLALALGAAGMVGIWDWDLKADVIYADANFARIYALDPAQATRGAPLSEYIKNFHPDDMPAFQAEFKRVFDGAPEFSCEYRILQPDGSTRWVHARGKLVRDADGTPIRFPGATVDITDRKQFELQIQELNATLEQRIEERTLERDRAWKQSRDLQLVSDEYGVLLAVNDAWTDVLGWTAEELVGQPFFNFVYPDDQQRTGVALNQLMTVDIPSFENRYLHKNGGFRWIAWVSTSSNRQVYSSGRHITAEKEAEASMLSMQEQLRQSQKMEAVGQLTGGLAHDFNNLLTSITSSLELMHRRVEQGRNAELPRYISVAQGAAKRAAALTHRMLAFSRRQTLDAKATDVNQLVGGMEELIRRTTGPAITLEVVGAVGLWTVHVDPHQLESALLNLCINSKDAMPNGGRVTIETANQWIDDRVGRERDLPPGEYVSLCVTDSGTGMPPDVIERVFEPFFTTKPIGLGTGLGLSMVYGFARQSGGQVHVDSEVGRGTTMCMLFPRHYESDVDAPDDTTHTTPSLRGIGTVLVVDDETGIRSLVTEALRDIGYLTIDAENGAAALKIVQSGARVDFLVTDVGLPGGMNGRQLADAVKSLRPQLKVLFITGYAENSVMGNGRLEEDMFLLSKPFTLDQLALRLEEMSGDGR